MSFYKPKISLIDAVQFIYGDAYNLKVIKAFVGESYTTQVLMNRHPSAIAELQLRYKDGSLLVVFDKYFIIRDPQIKDSFYLMPEKEFLRKYELLEYFSI